MRRDQAVEQLGSDKLDILAVSTLKRAPVLPNVPSIAEAGYPKAEYVFWNGLSMPVKTPRAIVEAGGHCAGLVFNRSAVQRPSFLKALCRRTLRTAIAARPSPPRGWR